MVCKRGHSLVGARIYMKLGYPYRFCLECRKIREERGGILRPEMAKKIKVALARGATITSFTASGQPDYLVKHITFKAYRRTDPEIDALTQNIISTAHIRSQKLRWVRVRNAEVRDQNNDYHKIMAMLPSNHPERDAIVSAIFEDLLSGALQRQARIHSYVTAHNRMFPTKFAKFGNGPLVSLDEVLFDDGRATRGDTVSRGLWD
jgi:hypothetical protein